LRCFVRGRTWGRPRGRSVDSSCRRFAHLASQVASPNGRPRRTLWRMLLSDPKGSRLFVAFFSDNPINLTSKREGVKRNGVSGPARSLRFAQSCQRFSFCILLGQPSAALAATKTFYRRSRRSQSKRTIQTLCALRALLFNSLRMLQRFESLVAPTVPALIARCKSA
jgi:hypothetical protein